MIGLSASGAAQAIVLALEVYFGLGILFAIAFAWRGAAAIDPGARDATAGFRILIVPARALLWPLLLRRWLRRAPPPENTTHTATPRLKRARRSGGTPKRTEGASVIRRLRRRHRATWLAIAILLPFLYLIALAARQSGAHGRVVARSSAAPSRSPRREQRLPRGRLDPAQEDLRRVPRRRCRPLSRRSSSRSASRSTANATIETQLIRALGTCALLLLHVILAIGPLARLDRRFLPLLYNRRHLGVTMFLLALGARRVRAWCSSTRSAT